ncbi:hypothetical protein [Stutzerimonas nitrititolerans]|uniref:hypothetical protein n=1 Tax=Stutzerimonas nitrititolerans TaxID=2482751 RepID=UPI0028A71482|nr:hypothetical protein [Stutzerimonas nitrititolerans]
MSRKYFTSEQAHVLTLPVVLTEKAWREAVHIEQPKSLTEVAQRLAYTLKAAWHAFMDDPVAERAEFGINRFPPSGDRSHKRFLALKAERKRLPESDSWNLIISLKFEDTEGTDR